VSNTIDNYIDNIHIDNIHIDKKKDKLYIESENISSTLTEEKKMILSVVTPVNIMKKK